MVLEEFFFDCKFVRIIMKKNLLEKDQFKLIQERNGCKHRSERPVDDVSFVRKRPFYYTKTMFLLHKNDVFTT